MEGACVCLGAYWPERPAGSISKARGQGLTQDYITDLPQAAVLCQSTRQHADFGLQNPGS